MALPIPRHLFAARVYVTAPHLRRILIRETLGFASAIAKDLRPPFVAVLCDCCHALPTVGSFMRDEMRAPVHICTGMDKHKAANMLFCTYLHAFVRQ